MNALQQHYDQYTAEDRHVWQLLFERQLQALPGRAAPEFMEGLARIGFTADRIPDFRQTNQVLRRLTGWELVAVPGIVDDAVFFGLLAARKFPATTWLRKLSELDYLEEPDMFHDVFGHVPLLTNLSFCRFLHQLGHIGTLHASDAGAAELLARLYWFTVEFGLIRDAGSGAARIYGAGILSSAGETRYSLGPEPTRQPFDIAQVLDTAFRKDVFQTTYFVLDSFEQLLPTLPAVQRQLRQAACLTESAD
ncbi:phenylalanine 4-monooxygenase [Hymenobacter busanensis]|uniref:Phenylalanine-4-hydroxylase n=1 Tax=Hymenobacter busanensis TaxID=2607656 RepID=A0A7L4ZSM5_9BACT|nr:phenylalanine 4-monooxygenase [Hymenobacter busanensis]KAA9327561.1 phenylalanine 4-monooxygenase [Hymenobacter busanensis]QHJ06101.1 phenylalanine 4-monooxygenase [Hymenobacter busanensis]